MRKAEAKARWVGRIRDLLFSLGVLAAASGICLLLSQVNDDNNPFAMAVFILAVAVISSRTSGYWYGVGAACAGVLCVNYLFTRPFFQFNWSATGYPLTFAAMLLVSIIISTLTIPVKAAGAAALRYGDRKAAGQSAAFRLSRFAHAAGFYSGRQLRAAGAEKSVIGGTGRTGPGYSEGSPLADPCDGEHSFRHQVYRFRREAEKEDEAVEEIVSSAIVKFRRHHPEMSITVKRPESILWAPMDATLVEQVLLNLFENAAAHGKNANTIQVSILPEPGRAAVVVEDNGAGFSPEALEHLFDGFSPPVRVIRTIAAIWASG